MEQQAGQYSLKDAPLPENGKVKELKWVAELVSRTDSLWLRPHLQRLLICRGLTAGAHVSLLQTEVPSTVALRSTAFTFLT